MAAMGLPAAATAQTLLDAWRLTRTQEPSLQAARSNLEAAAERTKQAIGALLPQFNASASGNYNRRSYVQGVILEGDEVFEKYNARTKQVNLSQALWRPASTAARRQADQSARQAAFQVAAAEQEAMSKLVTAWLDLMSARDAIVYSAEQVTATAQQVEVFRRGLALGVGSDVQLAEARSKHLQAQADAGAAQYDLEAKLAALEQLTGLLPAFSPPQLQTEFERLPIRDLEPAPVWLALIEQHSPVVLGAMKALAAAQEEVRKQRAQHEPTLDLVGSVTYSKQGSGTTPGQLGFRSRQDTIGLQLNVPLFAGGTTLAKVREAVALAAKAEYELDFARRQATTQARQAWAAASAAIGRALAGTEAVLAAQLALRAATTGEATGLKTKLDELNAKHQLAQARRDQLRAHYDGLAAVARLKAATGTLDEEFLARLQALFAASS